MLRALLFLLISLPIVAKSQNYPQNYFQSPLNIPLALSGTFGELRSNHFHSGVDIKTQGVEGLPVLAPADGQVVRIKVSAYGFGNALYIAHPNGYTTVYGHLQGYTPEVAAYIKEQQYAKKSFEVDLFPPAGKFVFKQGELIAKSGNTGGSGGPHLHFEIRDSKTEETINPILFGLQVADTKKPEIAHLYAEPISANAIINGFTSTREIGLTRLSDGIYTGNVTAAGTFGLVLHTFDQQNLSNNHNGIYSITQFVNDTPTYAFTIDKFAFSDSRYVNAHIDFARYKTNKQLTHNCFVLPGNKLPNYSNLINQGYLSAQPGVKKMVKLVVTDSWGNKSEIRLTLTGDINEELIAPEQAIYSWKLAHTIKAEGFKLYLPAGTLYKDEVINLTPTAPCAKCESKVYGIGKRTIPPHDRFTLSLHKDQLSKTEKLVWAAINSNGNGSGLTTKWEGDWLVAQPKEFGNYAVMQDLTPPNLSVSNFSNGKTVSRGSRISMTAKDELSGITFYEATIDGNWVLLEYDAKRAYFWHDFESSLSAGSHVITLVFTDEVGNTTSFQSVFNYQP